MEDKIFKTFSLWDVDSGEYIGAIYFDENFMDSLSNALMAFYDEASTIIGGINLEGSTGDPKIEYIAYALLGLGKGSKRREARVAIEIHKEEVYGMEHLTKAALEIKKDFLETYYDITETIVLFLQDEDNMPARLQKIYFDKGRGGMYKLCHDLAREFQNIYEEEQWGDESGKDYQETLDVFLDLKLN